MSVNGSDTILPMSLSLSRRQWLAASSGAAAFAAARPQGLIIDTHIHLFDPRIIPYHPQATYRPEERTLAAYTKFVRESGLNHSVIVHPEPYQDDHRSLEYFLAHEPSPGYFKGPCLFDPVAPETPRRMEELVKRNPGRIVALRIHESRKCSAAPTAVGTAIRDRDMRAPGMRATWRKAHELGLAIQMHFVPCHAPAIRAVAADFREMPVIIDHLGRYNEGTPAEWDEMLRLSELPRMYLKFSAIRMSSKQGPPYADAKPLVRRVVEAFGADRIIWGAVGMTMPEFETQVRVFETLLDFVPESGRAKIRGLNAAKLYGFKV